MCTPRYDVTLDRFMRVAHPLPRLRGNVAVDNHTFVNALPWTCRAGAPWRGLPERHGKWVTVYRRFNRWSGDGAMEHLLMDRAHEGDPTRPPAESFGLTPVAPPKRNRTPPWDCDREACKGRNMVERVFNRMKHHRKAATRQTGPTRPSSPTSGSSSSTHLPEKTQPKPN